MADTTDQTAAGRAKAEGRGARPFTFGEAVAFQWVNPKAWAMAIGVPAATVRDILAPWL